MVDFYAILFVLGVVLLLLATLYVGLSNLGDYREQHEWKEDSVLWLANSEVDASIQAKYAKLGDRLYRTDTSSFHVMTVGGWVEKGKTGYQYDEEDGWYRV